MTAASDNLMHVLVMLLLMLYLSDGISMDDSEDSDDSDFESAADKSKSSLETPLSGSGKFESTLLCVYIDYWKLNGRCCSYVV